MTRLRSAVLFLLCLGASVASSASVCDARDARLSGAVAFATSPAPLRHFLEKPGPAYVQAYMRFGADMPDDVIIAIDHEFLEGIEQPLFVSGGDWMAFVGVQRGGAVWVAAGTDKQTKDGVPSNDRDWKIFDLKTRLEPDTWYRLRIEADFGKRRFKSFTIDGGGLTRTFDLSAYALDYPNHMPFSARAMTYFVVAMRSRAMMRSTGTPRVYFDDVEGGVQGSDGKWVKVFSDGFEKQATVGRQPLTSPVVELGSYAEGKWYLERDESLIRIERAPFARSGSAVGVADATLD